MHNLGVVPVLGPSLVSIRRESIPRQRGSDDVMSCGPKRPEDLNFGHLGEAARPALEELRHLVDPALLCSFSQSYPWSQYPIVSRMKATDTPFSSPHWLSDIPTGSRASSSFFLRVSSSSLPMSTFSEDHGQLPRRDSQGMALLTSLIP